MVNLRRFWRNVGLTGVSFVAMGIGPLVAQEKAPPVIPADPSKTVRIERGATDVVRRSAAPIPGQPESAAYPGGVRERLAGDATTSSGVARPRFDTPKMAAIEVPALTALRASASSKAGAGADSFLNPKVAPGKVAWHQFFEAACAASAKSGKPVLLFQMMGKLDDEFC